MRASLVPGTRAATLPRLSWLIAVAALAALFSIRPGEPRAAGTGRDDDPRRSRIVKVVDRVKGAVVNIHSERTVRGPAVEELFAHTPLQNRVNGMGTGIVVDPRGFVVTNFHVVEDVSSLRVRLSDNSTHGARVIARDKENDLALIKVDVETPLPTIPLGTASDLMVGEDVIAIGNAYGYDYTVTKGIVSAVRRDVSLNREISYKGLIQTDASINPGNSGGPLLNIHGELVGVNVAIRAGAQGISFAIPVETMIKAATQMFRSRNQSLAHGIIVKDVAECGDDYCVRRQLVVETVESGSPAARAGVQSGDVLVRVGKCPTVCALDLERSLFGRASGDLVPVVLRRQGEEKSVDLVLAASERPAAPVVAAPDLIWSKLGVRLKQAAVEQVASVNPQLHGGLNILDVRSDSPASKAGMKAGDILIGLHQWETVSPDNVVFVLTHKDLATFQPLGFYLVRSGQVHKGWLQQID